MRAPDRSTLGRALLVAALMAPAAFGQEAAGRPPVIVHLADGSSFPLRPWSLSYEIASWRQGSSPALASFARVELADLLVGKKGYPTAGATLEIQYDEVEREREVDGETRRVKVPMARSLTLVGADGKKAVLKPEPPARELLVPAPDKTLIYQVRSLDLQGQTLTGTKRAFCLLSFTTLVECNDTLGQQVAKIEFQK